jgi:hypothetical protein
MVTATLILMCVLLVVAAGEAVRGQCRRMLTNPVAVRASDAASVTSSVVGQELAA